MTVRTTRARPWSALRFGLSAVTLVMAFADSAHPAAATGWSPETCAAERELLAFTLGQPDIFDPQGPQVRQLEQNLQTLCDDQSAAPPSSAPQQDRPTPQPVIPQPTPEPRPMPGPPVDSQDRNDACKLLIGTEVEPVIGGAANADTPAALPGASGCEYRPEGAGNQPYLDVIYAQADGNALYATLLSSAGQETGAATHSVSGVGEQAFTYVGSNGPGIVVLKANKVVVLEFSYTNPGDTALITLAGQAAGRVS